MHAAGGNLDLEAAATGVYIGCMYTEYLDAILGPSVSSQPHVVPTVPVRASAIVPLIADTTGMRDIIYIYI